MNIEALTPPPPLDPELVQRFTQAAVAEGLADVVVGTHETPVGDLTLAATNRGLVRVGLPNQPHAAVLEELAAKLSPRVLRAPSRMLEETRRQLDQFFSANRTTFELDLDWRLTGGFRREVLAATAALGFGQTASYAEMAARAGRPRAVRAAGSALATNPLPLVVPCHRVLRSDGSLGGYGGGLAMKTWLLDFERGE